MVVIRLINQFRLYCNLALSYFMVFYQMAICVLIKFMIISKPFNISLEVFYPRNLGFLYLFLYFRRPNLGDHCASIVQCGLLWLVDLNSDL